MSGDRACWGIVNPVDTVEGRPTTRLSLHLNWVRGVVGPTWGGWVGVGFTGVIRHEEWVASTWPQHASGGAATQHDKGPDRADALVPEAASIVPAVMNRGCTYHGQLQLPSGNSRPKATHSLFIVVL